MLNVKKVATFALALIVPISLLSGYFCYAMPMIAPDAPFLPHASYSSACQDAPQGHFMLTSANSGQAIAPCCVEKSENDRTTGIILTNFSFDNADYQSTNAERIIDIDSIGSAVLLDFPISPPPRELLASVIKIE